MERVVIVTPSVYGTDNSATQFGMMARGADARGVAVIDDKTPESRPRRHAQGRLPRHPAQSRHRRHQRSECRPRAAAGRASSASWRAAGTSRCTPTSPMITAIKDLVMTSPVPLVFDHFGGAQAALGVRAAGLCRSRRAGEVRQGLCEDLRRLSLSKLGPEYPTASPLAQALIAANQRSHRLGHRLAASGFGNAARQEADRRHAAVPDRRRTAAQPAAGVGAGRRRPQEDPGRQSGAAVRVLSHQSVAKHRGRAGLLASGSIVDHATSSPTSSSRRTGTGEIRQSTPSPPAGAAQSPRTTSSGPVSVKSRPNRPIWPRSARIELPMPQRSANFVSVAGVAGPARPTITGRSIPARIEARRSMQDRRAFETELGDGIDRTPVRRRPTLPGRKDLQRMVIIQERMALGMTGNAHGSDAVRLDQAGGGGIEARFERPLAAATSPAIRRMRRTSASPRAADEEIAERLIRDHFARGDMRHRIEAGAAQCGRGLDIVAVIIAGQKGDGDVDAARKMVRQLRQLTPARGNFDGGLRQQFCEIGRVRSRAAPEHQAGARRREIT